MTKVMTLSENGAKFIKRHEGFRDHYYDLGDGVVTFGFGNTMSWTEFNKRGLKIGQKIPVAELERIFETKIQSYINNTNIVVGEYGFTGKLNQNQFDVLVSYCYNRGPGNKQGTNGLRQLLKNSKTVTDIGNNLPVYWGTAVKFKKGLLNRRNAEKLLFFTPVPGGGTTKPSAPATEMVPHRLKSGSYPSREAADLARLKVAAQGIASATWSRVEKAVDGRWCWVTGAFASEEAAQEARKKVIAKKIASTVHVIKA